MRTTPAIIEIIGYNGEQWTVSGPGMGAEGVELAPGPGGLHDGAPITGLWRSSAFEEGATYQGHKIEPLDLVLGFNILPSADNWEEIESRFYASFHEDPRHPAQIVITTESCRRVLNVVKLEEAKTESDLDPRIYQYSKMQITLRAWRPFWQGEQFTETLQFDGSGTKQLVVENRTDRPMWLKWAATAPGKWSIPDYDLTPGSANRARRIVTPVLSAGQDLTIDTYPLELTYVADNGSNVSGLFNGVDFLHAVPPHTPPTAYNVTFEGTSGEIMCVMKEEWKRPWGGHY